MRPCTVDLVLLATLEWFVYQATNWLLLAVLEEYEDSCTTQKEEARRHQPKCYHQKCSWVISVFLPQVKLHHPQVPSSISEQTAVRWLNQLGSNQHPRKRAFILMVTSTAMLWNTGNFTCTSWRYWNQPTSHYFLSVMILLPNHLITKSLFCFFFLIDESAYHSNDDQKQMCAQ